MLYLLGYDLTWPRCTGCRTLHLLRALERHSHLAGRGPNSSSLFLPQAAVVAVALWPFSAENLFFISRLSRPAGRSKRIFTKGDAMESCILSGRWVGSFSEDRPLGWDPVAEGNRAGDGMACNSNDRRQWRKQEVAVGTAANRMRVLLKARSIRWVPQPVLVSEEKATDTLAVRQFTSVSSANASCRPQSG